MNFILEKITIFVLKKIAAKFLNKNANKKTLFFLRTGKY